MATDPMFNPMHRNKLSNEEIAILKNADPDNYISIRFNHNINYVLPFMEGVKLLECLSKAEQRTNKKIYPVDSKIDFSINILSKEDYITYKMNHLLNKDEEPF